MKQKLFGKLSMLLIVVLMLTATQQLYASSLRDTFISKSYPERICFDTVPIRAYKNALIVADSLDRAKQEIAALRKLDSISDIIIDTLIKAIKLKEKQLQISKSINKDYANMVVVASNKVEQFLKAAKTELFWKRFFQFTTVAALTLVAVK